MSHWKEDCDEAFFVFAWTFIVQLRSAMGMHLTYHFIEKMHLNL
jgi:hypothetical protein